MIAIPLQDERELALAHRLSLPSPNWRVSRSWTRIAFFILACMATSTFFGLLALLHLPKGWIAAIVAVGFAEHLVRNKRFLRTGIEEGFYIAGLCAFIFGLPSEGKPEAALVFMAAFLIAGFRVANGLFVAVAAALAIVYAGWKAESVEAAAAAATVIFAIAALLHAREIARPFLDSAAAILTASLAPLALILWWVEVWEKVPLWQLALAAIACVAMAAIALVRRDRALLLGGIGVFAIAALEVSNRLTAPWEWKLLAAGITSLVAALVLNRMLRNRERGITSDKLIDIEHAGVIEMAGAAIVTPAAIPERKDDGLQTGGGSFGGAGATGDYR
jgi:hypothetical protein